MGKVLVVAAVICFGLAAFELVSVGFHLVPLGLALWAGSSFVD